MFVLQAFGEDFLEDKLKPFFKSDPIPETVSLFCFLFLFFYFFGSLLIFQMIYFLSFCTTLT